MAIITFLVLIQLYIPRLVITSLCIVIELVERAPTLTSAFVTSKVLLTVLLKNHKNKAEDILLSKYFQVRF